MIEFFKQYILNMLIIFPSMLLMWVLSATFIISYFFETKFKESLKILAMMIENCEEENL